jgi:hypothetical protein
MHQNLAMNALRLGCLGVFALLASVPAYGQTNLLRIEVQSSRSPDLSIDREVRRFAAVFETLNSSALDRRGVRRYLSPPVRVELLRNGRPIPAGGRTRNGGLTLQFETGGNRAFPPVYQSLLQNTFDAARTTLNLVFGAPARSGTVRVLNYDADLTDRDAVAGGVYVAAGLGGIPEIRFPVYNNTEAAALNFLHTVLLAYQGERPYPFDAYQEGFARAALMRVARTPAAVPGLDPDQIEAVLTGTYDVGALYDWTNQRSLGGERFIAPNLRDVSLPAGGSLGGIFLQRYIMSGSVWLKVLAEHPTFIATFNGFAQGRPTTIFNPEEFIAVGQQTLNTIRPGDPTIEGLRFREWAQRQFILETRNTAGLKLLVEPIPIVSGLTAGDFGVFNIQTTYLRADGMGNETLLRGTSFPIFWDVDENRVLPDAQSERMDIVAGYGSVTPNFEDRDAGRNYRIALDVPLQDQVHRAYVPAGAVARPGSPVSDFYGTVSGVSVPTGGTLSVRVSSGAFSFGDVAVQQGAFGTRFGTPLWLDSRVLDIAVLRTNSIGVSEVAFTRRVNKGPGPLALDLRAGDDGAFILPLGIPAGLSLIGFPTDPYRSFAPDLLGLSPAETQVARWDPSTGRYALFPEVEPFQIGRAYFVRAPRPLPFAVAGRVTGNLSYPVALRPGWNLVTTPNGTAVPLSRIRVVRGTEFPVEFPDARGTEIGADFFEFVPGAADAVSGLPETGTFRAATLFEPGKGYFVRCLAAEGVTLVFRPASGPTTSAQTRTRGTSGNYRIRVDVTGGGEAARAILGLSDTATQRFDPAEDSPLPPGIGGLQVVSVNDGRWYRDTRRRKGRPTFTVQLEGLRPGRRYRVQFLEELMRSPHLSVLAPGGKSFRIRGSGHFDLLATAATARYTVRVVAP